MTRGAYEIETGDLAVEPTVYRLLEHALNLQVSDIFLLSGETEITVAMRHLGTVQKITTLPAEKGLRCLSHIKVMARMDVAERRRPQDGRWIAEMGNRRVDLRVNAMPTMYGED